MKKIVSILLAAALMLSATACSSGGVTNTPTADGGESSTADTSSTSSASSEAEEETEPGRIPKYTLDLANAPTGGTFIIGTTTSFQNDFMPGWTNGSSNLAVRSLVGMTQYYDTYTMTREGEYIVNTAVVKDIKNEENADKTKTWTIQLHNDLKWSDGTPITAKDYVFGGLLYSSKEIGELEADATAGVDIVGYEDFNEGKTKTFSGIRLLDEYSFSITMKAEKRPFHWEDLTASFTPMPFAAIAPGVELTDSGSGATLSDAFTADLLRTSLLDPDKGYRYHPSPVCGPYTMEKFDTSANQVTLKRNEQFKGTYDGVKPHIDTVVLKVIAQDTMVDELRAGSVDALFQVGGGEKINNGLQLVDEGKAQYISSYQYGYSNWQLQCDFGPTQFKNVRKALAYLYDREESLKQLGGGYGKVIDAPYGLGTFEYQNRGTELEKKLTHYNFDPEKAKQLLIEDGWTKNEKGGDFVEGTDTVRYKDVDGKLMKLEIEILCTESKGTDLAKTMIPPEAAKVGMNLILSTADFSVLLDNLYREGVDAKNLKYHGFSLATGFATVPSPWYDWSIEPGYLGLNNACYIDDKGLRDVAEKMKKVPLDDKEAWLDGWVELMVTLNDVMPVLPTSTGEMYSFVNPKVKNVGENSLWQFRFDVPYMYIEQ